MLQKIINFLSRLINTPLFGAIGGVELGTIASLLGYSLSDGISKIKLSNLNAQELAVITTAIENRDLHVLKDSALFKTLYEVITFEDVKVLIKKPEILPTLTGPVIGLLPYEDFLALVDSFAGPEMQTIKD